MKIKMILMIVLIIPAFFLQAQDADTSPKHELGIGVANLINPGPTYFPLYPYYDILPYYPYYYQQPSLGMNYRYHTGNGAWRIGLELSFRSERSDNEYSKSKNSQLSTGLRSGYEFHKTFKKVEIFYGTDLFATYASSSGEYKTKGSWDESSNTSDNLQIGISPLAGVRYYITPNLSLSTETQFRMNYYQNWYQSSYNLDESNSFSDGFQMGFAPIGILSFNIHF